MTDLGKQLKARRKELEAELETIKQLLAVLEAPKEQEAEEPRRVRGPQTTTRDEWRTKLLARFDAGEEVIQPELKREAGQQFMTARRALESLVNDGLVSVTMRQNTRGPAFKVYQKVASAIAQEEDVTRPPKSRRRQGLSLHVASMGPRDSEIKRHERGEVDVRRVTSQ